MDRLEALKSFERMVTDGQDWGDLEGESEHGFTLVTLLSPNPYALSDLNAHFARKAYGGSLDAARDLHEAVLPDEGWRIEWAAICPNLIPGGSGFSYTAKVGWAGQFQGHANKPARAWLLAIIRVLIAQQEAEHDS